MSQAIAADMARRSLDTLLERIGEQRTPTPEESRELSTGCQLAGLVADRLWQTAKGLLDQGAEEQRYGSFLKQLADVLALQRKALEDVIARIQASGLDSDEKAAILKLLEDSDRQAAERHDWTTRMLEWLQRPRPPVDPSKLPKAGECSIEMNEFLSKLLAGGSG